MSFRTALLPALNVIRAITGPSGLDVRTHRLTIRTRRWTGDRVHEGVPVDTDLVLPAIFPVRKINDQEVNERGGQYETNDVIVDNITPTYPPDQLNPLVTTDNVEIIYVLTGPHAGEYNLMEFHSWQAFSYALVLRRRATTP